MGKYRITSYPNHEKCVMFLKFDIDPLLKLHANVDFSCFKRLLRVAKHYVVIRF